MFRPTRSQFLFTLVIASLLISGAAGFANPAKAVVAFNTFPIDYTPRTNYDLPMIDARNAAGGNYSVDQADHNNGVQAVQGDIVGFVIYYHNSGVAEDVATNVTIKASLPGGTRQSHEVSAAISSSQTAAVSSSDPLRGGNIVININGSPQTLTFIPGSVRWFPERSTSGQTLADGDNLVTSGVNIGSVKGCFQFSGFITFRAQVGNRIPIQNLSLTKNVLNVTNGGSFQKSVSANPGDRIRFQIQIATSGDAQQTAIVVRDSLPSNLSFISGSEFLNSVLVANENDLFNTGKNLGTLSPNVTQTIIFDAYVAGSSAFSGNTTLTNIATVRSDQVGTVQDSANVNVQVQANIQNLSLTKNVLNVTNGGSFQKSVSANPGDRIRFQIVVNTSGNAQQGNVIVRDSLPSNLSYIQGSEQVNNTYVGNEYDLFNNGRNLGTLSPNVTQTIIFDAYVAGSSAFSGNTALTNIATVRSDQVGNVQDSASVLVQQNSGNQNLSITKTVYDVTTGSGSFQKSVSANPGDRIRFQIVVNTSGNTSQSNVIVRDILPGNLTYVSGTLQINSVTTGGDFDFFGGGRNLGTLSANSSQTLVFDAIVAGGGAFGNSTTLTNTANVRSDQAGTVQDTANVFVGVVLGTSFQIRKTAFNVTQGMDATTVAANPGDVISYTLYYKNTGQTSIQGAVIDDDVSDIRQLADVIDQGGAVSINGDIKFAPVDVPSGVEISRTFQVRVRNADVFPADSDLVMTNVYGNTINISVSKPQIKGVITPPRTGAGEWLVTLLALAVTLGYWVYRRFSRRTELQT